jgi:hypothetical protein
MLWFMKVNKTPKVCPVQFLPLYVHTQKKLIMKSVAFRLCFKFLMHM